MMLNIAYYSHQRALITTTFITTTFQTRPAFIEARASAGFSAMYRSACEMWSVSPQPPTPPLFSSVASAAAMAAAMATDSGVCAAAGAASATCSEEELDVPGGVGWVRATAGTPHVESQPLRIDVGGGGGGGLAALGSTQCSA